jgi:hypothetical protein
MMKIIMMGRICLTASEWEFQGHCPDFRPFSSSSVAFLGRRLSKRQKVALTSAIFWRAEKNLRQAKFKLVSRGELLRAKKLLRSGCGKPLALHA